MKNNKLEVSRRLLSPGSASSCQLGTFPIVYLLSMWRGNVKQRAGHCQVVHGPWLVTCVGAKGHRDEDTQGNLGRLQCL